MFFTLTGAPAVSVLGVVGKQRQIFSGSICCGWYQICAQGKLSYSEIGYFYAVRKTKSNSEEMIRKIYGKLKDEDLPLI